MLILVLVLAGPVIDRYYYGVVTNYDCTSIRQAFDVRSTVYQRPLKSQRLSTGRVLQSYVVNFHFVLIVVA